MKGVEVRRKLGSIIRATQWFDGDEPLKGMVEDEDGDGDGFAVPTITDPRVLTPVNHGDWIVPIEGGFEVVPDIYEEYEPAAVCTGFELYSHHNLQGVWVRKELKGRHREHCLCYSCDRFKPEDREKNCQTANFLYEVCRTFNIVIPVWGCPKFGEDTSKPA